MTFDKILKYYNTVKYLKLAQTAGRVFSGVKKKLFQNFPETKIPETKIRETESSETETGETETGNELPVLNCFTPFLQHDPWNCRENILIGKFTFLNVDKLFPSLSRIDWNSIEMPLLWRFNLHYFSYLYLLEDAEKQQICRDWINKNSNRSTVGWHPYPLSLRIVNWIKARMSDRKIAESLYKQAAYLYNNLETYHPGNHLLENARALIFAGIYLRGWNKADKWFKKGVGILKKQLPVQVLNDGGYFERSTMYHSLMFECLLDIMNILPAEGNKELKDLLAETAEKMGIFLESMTHPDRKISLFNDSTFEIAPKTDELLSYSSRVIKCTPFQNSSFSDSGFYVYRDRNVYLVIDGGPIGPDYLPAHSHADIFSYELSLFSKRVIVDSGVYEYPAGEMRTYVRSTRAHNTVSVDNLDQAECWDSFRVARRYPPSNVNFELRKDCCIFQGSFDGYASLIGNKILHKRKIISDSTSRTILVDDYISGNGRHTVRSFVHLSPYVKIQFVDNIIIITTSDNKKIKLIIESGQFSLENGWYCPRFGERIQNIVLVIKENILPAQLSYRISY